MTVLDRPIIQGGMGVAVSDWRLARAVSRLGQLGVVSGAAIAAILAARLNLGDPDGSCRRALERFPYPAIASAVLSEHFVPGGKAPTAPFRRVPMATMNPSRALVELMVVAAFVEVFLAKEGHGGAIGMNLLEKIQLPTLPILFGAMLAGVDAILMGAGIPRQIPGVLDRLARGEAAELRIDVEGAQAGEEYVNRFDPAAFAGGPAPVLARPAFLAIVASATLATSLARKSSGHVDGFVIELDTAGGHNAPPRGPLTLSPEGEPVYGPRDVPDLEAFRALGRPFWLAGSFGRAGKLREARAAGAVGVQVGTAFAFCEESGIDPALKHATIRRSRAGEVRVFTDPLASPTGFPFKVVPVPGSMSEAAVCAERERACDLGLLRHPYRRDDGSVGYRCPAEPIDAYLRKGGALAETDGRKCVCNGLASTVGLGQVRSSGYEEPVLLTAGNDVADVHRYAAPGHDSYTAADVVRQLLAEAPSREEDATAPARARGVA